MNPEPAGTADRRTRMTRLRGSWAAAVAAASVFLISACARPVSSGSGEGPAGRPSPSEAGGDSLVLKVERVGGFMAPDQQIGKLPVVSVYADGRIISVGPTTMQFPGQALPNIIVQKADKSVIDDLLAKADKAGVRAGVDLGRPGVADAPTTRITVVTGGSTRTVDAVALTEAQPNDPRLTTAQRDARAKLAAFVQEATDLPSAAGMPAGQPYVARSIAALARPYSAPQDALPTPPAPVAWPGAALPGATLAANAGCVTVTGADATKVYEAAKTANSITPWTSGGKQWSVVFRPLLPDETGCADLKGAK
jgi:hypothetical protein